jgi:peptide/nickel transport system permease protein
MSGPRARAAAQHLWRTLGTPFSRLGRRGQLGALLLLLVGVAAVLAPVLSPYDPLQLDGSALLQAPSLAHPLGTDPYGRDTLTRILVGAQHSLLTAGLAVALALLGGGGAGLLAGYYGGRLDQVLCRIADVLLSLPALLLCLAILTFLDGGAGPGDSLVRRYNVAFAIGVIYMGPLLRVTRAAVLTVTHETYVEACRALGGSDWHVLWRTVLPNAAGPILIEVTLRLASALLAEASLSFLGLGTQPPAPSWGEMIADGRRYLLLSPWGSVAPGVMLGVVVLACNLLGEALRGALLQPVAARD